MFVRRQKTRRELTHDRYQAGPVQIHDQYRHTDLYGDGPAQTRTVEPVQPVPVLKSADQPTALCSNIPATVRFSVRLPFLTKAGCCLVHREAKANVSFCCSASGLIQLTGDKSANRQRPGPTDQTETGTHRPDRDRDPPDNPAV